VEPLAEDVRVGARHLEQLNVLEAALAQERRRRLRALPHRRGVEAGERDARDPHQPLQVLELLLAAARLVELRDHLLRVRHAVLLLFRLRVAFCAVCRRRKLHRRRAAVTRASAGTAGH
jgi:hypothetical protein